jgi:hypothetical protein
MALIYGTSTSLTTGGDGTWGNPDDGDSTIRIYSYDTATGVTSLVLDTGIAVSDPNYGNAVALDFFGNTLYFVDSSNTLRSLDLTNPTLSGLGTVTYNGSPATTVSIGAQPATGYVDTALQFDNATFYAGSYWYIEPEKAILKRAILSGNTITQIDSYTLVDANGNPWANATNFFKFGDIAIDSNGNLFGWTVPTGGVSSFFKVDVTTTGTALTDIAPNGSNLLLQVLGTNTFSTQLAFSGPGGELFAHRTGLAQWFTVDQTNGNLTAAAAPTGYTGGLRDIAGQSAESRQAPASLGDYVWLDTNRNGIQDELDTGIEGVAVDLLKGGTVIKSTTTDATGFYGFNNLDPGTYKVRFTNADSKLAFTLKGQGSDPELDSNADDTGLTADIILPEGGSDFSIDAGLVKLATSKIGNYVWNDYNRNGIQDPTESGISGVKVVLFDDKGNPIDQTTTDASGYYLFDELVEGDYSVGFEKPSGFSFTTPKQGSDSATDSDADPITGKTTTISLPADTTDLSWDAGLFRDYTATGLTPGYWKNHTEQWDGGLSAGTTTYEGTMFSQWGTYGVTGLTKEVVTGAIKWQEPSKGKTSPVLEDMSLAKALDFGGGDGGGTYNPYGALARHSSAALLNASEDDLFGAGSANPAKGYRFNPDRVRQLTSMALTSDAIVRGVISAPPSPVAITLTAYEVEGSGVAAGTYTGLTAVENLHKVFAFNNQLGG